MQLGQAYNLQNTINTTEKNNFNKKQKQNLHSKKQEEPVITDDNRWTSSQSQSIAQKVA